MTTFPNTVLLRGEKTIVVDPGLPLQNEPVVGALAARGLGPADVDLVVLTHAHLDHAGACADLPAPVAVHELEAQAPHWLLVGGLLEALPLQLLRGDEGELAPGVAWARTPGHCPGHISLCVRRPTAPWPCAATPSGRAGPSSMPWRPPGRPPPSCSRRGGHPRLAPGARHRRPPGAVRAVACGGHAACGRAAAPRAVLD